MPTYLSKDEARTIFRDTFGGEDMANHLTRDEIAAIVQGMTARDLFAVIPDEPGAEIKGPELASGAFEAAAERQGYGPQVLDRISLADGPYLASILGDAMNETPKAEGSDSLPNSADSGESDPNQS